VLNPLNTLSEYKLFTYIIQNARYTVLYLYPLKQDRSNRSSRATCRLRESTAELDYNVMEGTD